MTEYIKNNVFTKQDERIDGIAYQSSKSAGKSIVIFADSEQCIDDDSDKNKRQEYRQKEPLLKLQNKPV